MKTWPQLIKMDGEWDCAAACIAMAVGLMDAKSAYPFLGYHPDEVTPKGVATEEVVSVLRLLGRVCSISTSKELIADGWKVPVEELSMRQGLSSEYTLRQKLGAMQKGCAIVGVPSLNVVGGMHFVFCHRGEIYDPSNKKRYVGMAQSLPVSEVIFIEEF